MNHTRSVPKNNGLLVSVRSLEEAIIAAEANYVSIIDLKEPSNGSLGCVSIDTARDIANALPGDIIKSIAIGELIDWPVWPSANPESSADVLSRFDFVKVGLSGMATIPDWVDRWKTCFEDLPCHVQRVAVAYADFELADSPPIEAIIASAMEVGCSVLLIDTFCKQQGGLLDHFPIDRLSVIIELARKQNLKVVLAGSLTTDSIAIVQPLNPDFVAVRGAVCRDDRTSMIDRAKVIAMGKQLANI